MWLVATLLACSGSTECGEGTHEEERVCVADDSGQATPALPTGPAGGGGYPSTLSEDCADGADNDGDALVDCEDGDCMEVCVEDCSNDADDDYDGMDDCWDPDCIDDTACAGNRLASMSLTLPSDSSYIEFDGVYVGGSPRSWSSELEAEILLNGTVSGDPFQCAGFALWTLAEDRGDCNGCDVRMRMQRVGSASWSAGCPVDANQVPLGILAVNTASQVISRHHNGTWAPQYGSPTRSESSCDDGACSFDWWGVKQFQPVVWSAAIP